MNKNRLKPSLRPPQKTWLRDRYDEGRNVMVMVGSPQGIVLFRDKKWETSQKILEIHTRDVIVSALTDFLRGANDNLIQLR
jgi:hypothetical protein